MDKQKVQFYHAQAAKLHLRRKWQCMAVWPIVFRHGNRLRMEFEFQQGPYRIDLYIPAIKFAIEIDEPFHDRQQEADEIRQETISTELGCEFFRIRVNDPRSIFQQVEQVCSEIQQRVNRLQPDAWVLAPPRTHEVDMAGYSPKNLDALRAARIPDRIEEMMRDLDALGISVSDEKGPVIPGNGELGFTLSMSGISFVVSMRVSGNAKLIVTQHSQEALTKLNLTLDGPKKGQVDYWVINEFIGRYPPEDVIDKIAIFKQILDS